MLVQTLVKIKFPRNVGSEAGGAADRNVNPTLREYCKESNRFCRKLPQYITKCKRPILII
jgi:hypothetical protein